MLQGAKGLLSSRNDIKVSVCVYHKADDAECFQKYFEDIGYQTAFTEGLVLTGSVGNKPLRKAVIRAWKTEM